VVRLGRIWLAWRMTASMIIGFVGLSLLLAMTPGPDTFLVLRFSLQNSRSGLAAATGSALGSLVWAFAVAVGLASLLEQSATAYRIVKIAGGLYLIYLGLRLLLRRRREAASDLSDRSAPAQTPVAAFGSGLLSCSLNPKVGLFFLAIVPQFVPPHASMFTSVLTLGVIDTVVAFGWLMIIVLIAARAVLWLRRPRITSALSRISATILTTFGLATLVSAE
jgi:threonine/homoserine/homoserine lactone efflux protein